MAISFEEWRASRSKGVTPAPSKPDFATWRKKRKQEEEDAKLAASIPPPAASLSIAPKPDPVEQPEALGLFSGSGVDLASAFGAANRAGLEDRQAAIAGMSASMEDAFAPTDGSTPGVYSIARGVGKIPQYLNTAVGAVSDLDDHLINAMGRLAHGRDLRTPTGLSDALAENKEWQGYVDEMFAAPEQGQRLAERVRQQDTMAGKLGAYLGNPVGTAQALGESLAGSLPLIRGLGIAAGAGAATAGEAAQQADAQFAEEVRTGIVQSSPEFLELSAQIGPERALEKLRNDRIALTYAGAGITGAVTARAASALGVNPAEQIAAGQAVRGSLAGKVLAEPLGEIPEEVIPQIMSNVAARSTGSNVDIMEGVKDAAAGAIVMGSGSALALGAAQDGVMLAREKLAQAGAYADGTKKAAETPATPEAQEAPPPAEAPKAPKPKARWDGQQWVAPEAPAVIPTKTVSEPVVTTPATTLQGTQPKAPQAAPTASETPAVAPKTPSARAMALAGKRVQADMQTDPAFVASVRQNPKTLQERVQAYAVIEQRKLDEKAAAKVATAEVKTTSTTEAAEADKPSFSLRKEQPDTANERYADRLEFMDDLTSGVLDPEAETASGMLDKIVTYSGDSDLLNLDPELAAKVAEAAAAESGDVTARPDAFKYGDKVYFDLSRLPKGQAKSAFLHEAKVHLARDADPKRASDLASRVFALAKLGDPTASAAVEGVRQAYSTLVKAARKNTSARAKARDEILANFAERVYAATKGGKGITGTMKRLYTDVVSYLRYAYTEAVNKYAPGLRLKLRDVDVLDAIRFGRDISKFKIDGLAEEPVVPLRKKEVTPSMSLGGKGTSPRATVAALKGTEGLGKVADGVLRLTRARGISSEDVFEMMHEAGNEAVSYQMQAENAARAVGAAVRAELGNKAVKGPNIQAELVKALSGEPNNLPQRVKDVVASEGRFLIDRLSSDLIALGAVDSKDIAKYAAQLGRYTHTGYKAWQLPEGVWESIMFAPNKQTGTTAGDKKIDSVIDQIKRDMTLTEAGLDASLKAATTGKKKTKARARARQYIVNQMYNYGIVGDASSTKKLEKAVKQLKAIARQQTPETLEADARDLARRAFNPKLDRARGITSPYAPFSVDMSALKSRKNVPPWLKELWGEFEEFDAVLINTVRNVGDMVARQRAMLGYKQILIDKGVLKDRVSRGYEPLKGKQFGPFDGMAIRSSDVEIVRNMANQGVVDARFAQIGGDLSKITGNALLSGILSGVQKASSMAKFNAIVADHTALFFNTLSATTIMPMSAGIWTLPKNAGNALNMARREALNSFDHLGKLTKQGEAQMISDLEALFRYGALGDAAISQDLRSELSELVVDEAYKDAPAFRRNVHALKAWFDKLGDKGSRLNAFGDTMGKMLSVYARMDWLSRIHPTWTREQLLKQASKETIAALPTYSRAMPLARAFGRTGFIGPFAVYASETMFRNIINETANGIRYITKVASEKGRATPEGRAATAYGISVLAGNAMRVAAMKYFVAPMMVGGYGLASALLAAGDEGDDEEKKTEIANGIRDAVKFQKEHYAAARRLLPEWIPGDVIFMRNTGEFKYVTGSVQRMDPYPYGALLSAAEDGDEPSTILWKALEPFVGSSMITAPFLDKIKYDKGMDEFALDIAKQVFVPGTVRRTLRTAVDEPAKGVELTNFEKAMDTLSGSVREIDFREELSNRMHEFQRQMNDLKGNVTKELSPDRPDISERYLGSNDFQSDFTAAVREQGELFVKFLRTIEAARGIGMTDEDIAIAAEDFRVSGDIDSWLAGKFVPPSAGEIIDKAYEAEYKKAGNDPKEIARVKKHYEPLYKYAEDLDQAVLQLLKKNGIPTYD